MSSQEKWGFKKHIVPSWIYGDAIPSPLTSDLLACSTLFSGGLKLSLAVREAMYVCMALIAWCSLASASIWCICSAALQWCSRPWTCPSSDTLKTTTSIPYVLLSAGVWCGCWFTCVSELHTKPAAGPELVDSWCLRFESKCYSITADTPRHSE